MGKRHDPLLDGHVRRLQPGRTATDVRDGEGRGLILRVLPAGRKYWTVRYRRQGKQRRLVLGTYPAMSVAQARKAARNALSRIDAKQDPVAELRAKNSKPADTVGNLAKEYLKRHAIPNKKSASEDERILDVDVLPKWKDRSVRELTRRDVRALLEPALDRKSPTMANRILAVVKKMLNFAVDRDWIDANPAARLPKPAREGSRDRVLTDDEIRSLWALLERFPTTSEKQAPGRRRAEMDTEGRPFCPISPSLAAVTKLRLITAQRGGEIIRMRWQDLDLDSNWWTIPSEYSKNGRSHRVPLTESALFIIERQRRREDSEFVFTGRDGALVHDRMKKAGAALSSELEFKFRCHDLRRTAATRMAEGGVPRQHISAVLNHVDGGPKATRVYDRYSYDGEKRIALENWERRLAAILSSDSAGDSRPNVIAFAKTGAR